MATPAAIVRAHQEIYAYWASLRRAQSLPARRDIDPGALKRHLPTISLIDVQREPLDFRMRLAGTGLYDLFGREITGEALARVYPESEAEEWRQRLERVVRTRKPLLGAGALAWRDGGRLSTFWLRLPLAADGQTVDMILGFDAVAGSREEPVSGVRAA